MLMIRTEGLSLYPGNSRILRDNHIEQLLSVPGGETLHRVWETGRARHDILELLIEAASGLGLAERRSRLSIVHTGLSKGVPGELSLGSVIIDLEILLIAGREGGEGGLIAVRPFLMWRYGSVGFNVISASQ